MDRDRIVSDSKVRGFTLLELVLVLAVVAVLVTLYMQHQFREMERLKAKKLGHDLFQYNVAIRRALVDQGTALVGVYSGVGWLQSGTCGGSAPKAYLPCGFSDQTAFGKTYSTQITADPAGYVTARTELTPIVIGGKVRHDLSGIAMLWATTRDTVKDTSNGFQSYFEEPDGRMVAIASTAADLDIWLRRDGANKMTGNLDMNGNNIVGANDVQVQGMLTAQDATITNQLDVGSQLNVNGPANVTGNLIARDVYGAFKARWLSQGAQDFAILADGQTLSKPSCPSGMIPQIYLSPVLFSRGPVAEPISAVQTWATDLGGSWRANLRILTTSGWVNPSPAYGRIMAAAKCG